METNTESAPAAAEAAVVTEAVLRVAKNLGISNSKLATIIGVSQASISRMGSSYKVAPGEKPFELSLLLIRLYRSLDAIVGGDDSVARQWLKNENTALNAVPLEMIQKIVGLTDVVAYLDARRGVV